MGFTSVINLSLLVEPLHLLLQMNHTSLRHIIHLIMLLRFLLTMTLLQHLRFYVLHKYIITPYLHYTLEMSLHLLMLRLTILLHLNLGSTLRLHLHNLLHLLRLDLSLLLRAQVDINSPFNPLLQSLLHSTTLQFAP